MEALRDACDVPLERMRRVSDAMLREMESGLSRKGEMLPMLPTYVSNFPTGLEVGQYFTLDLGGTNFRIAYVHLSKDAKEVEDKRESKWNIPKEIMEGTSDGLFRLLASSFKSFLLQLQEEGIDVSRERKIVAFTFSFPMDQTALDSGKLLFWTKGFDIPSCVGQDVVILLSNAFHEVGLQNVKIAAVLNDTVGTLSAAQYFDASAKIGVIFGTGSNAAYVEKAENIQKMPMLSKDNNHMIVDIEWSDFFTEELPIMSFDRKVDQESLHPGKASFEKMIGGMYIGEVARHIILEMVANGIIPSPSSKGQALLNKPDFITGNQVAEISQASGRGGEETQHLLQQLGFTESDNTSIGSIIQEIMVLVSKRAARLAAAGLYSVLKKMDLVGQGSTIPTVIAIDGSMYEHHCLFRQLLQEGLHELLGTGADKIKLQLTKDGSGLGAAIVAAVADRFDS